MNHDSLQNLLRARFSDAIARVLPGQTQADPLIRPAKSAQFGDYQCNAAMSLATAAGIPARELAQRIAAAASVADAVESLEVAGAGFINIRLRTEFIASYLAAIAAAPPPAETADGDPTAAAPPDRVGIARVDAPKRVLVDYSSPNIAKQMHVGHLRSTIIGDAFARVLGFLGHEVIRQNHVGDWGTAMGMVILGLWYIASRLRRDEQAAGVQARLGELRRLAGGGSEEARRAALQTICDEWAADLNVLELDDLARMDITLEQLELGYQFVQKLLEVDANVGCVIRNRDGTVGKLAEIPRKVTRMLQEGGAANQAERDVWSVARRISLASATGVYQRLGVLLREVDVCGESFYHDRLEATLAELKQRFAPGQTPAPDEGHAEYRVDEGAECIFLYGPGLTPRFRNPEGDELPLIVRKSDGAFLYATTDLAGVRYRIQELGAQRLIYVTDDRQRLHFEMFFAAARLAGWAGPQIELEHVYFGKILGPDRKPLKSREGDVPRLGDLLSGAIAAAYARLAARDADPDSPLVTGELSESEKRAIAERVGIAALKYNDLSNERTKDYVFDQEKMVALKGNTAPYLMYAYTRARGIGREAIERFGPNDPYAAPLRLAEPAERAVAMRLARFGESIEAVARELMPHILCTYLYDLAVETNRFYEACPVLRAEDPALRLSRLRLCDLTARTLRLGLWLLGIDVSERM